MDATVAKLVADLQHRIRILEDKDALHTLINTYCRVCDGGDLDLFNTLFTEDGELESTSFGTITGRESVAQAVASGKSFDGLMHSVTNIQLEVNGSDTATGGAYLSFYARPGGAKLHETFAFGGPYQFKFRREDGSWKFCAISIGRVWEQGEDATGTFRQKDERATL